MGASQYYKIGSPDDVTMLNKDQNQSYLNSLGSAMSNFSGQLGSNTSSAQQMYGKVADSATNYENFMKQMMGGGGMYENLRNDMSSGGLSSAANSALSDQYSSGREYASAAGTEARRQAANELSAAGLLSSGGGVGAMTEATAQPIMQMENQLANTRANYMQNRYATDVSGAGQAAQLGLGATQGQTQALGTAAQGYGGLANSYGSLYGQGLGYGAQLAEPTYYQPSYGSSLSDWASGIGLGDSVLKSIFGQGGGVNSAISGIAKLFAGG